MPSCLPNSLFPEQPQQQRQDDAKDQAGDNRKMKTEIALGITDVAGQTPEPALAEARPQQRVYSRQQQPGHHQKFAQVVHISKMAREAREGNEGFLTRISRIDTNCSAKRPGVRRQSRKLSGDAALGEMMIVGTRMLCGRWFKSGVAATADQDDKRFWRGWARADTTPPQTGRTCRAFRTPHSEFRNCIGSFPEFSLGWTMEANDTCCKLVQNVVHRRQA
jgi:hypothetical protein